MANDRLEQRLRAYEIDRATILMLWFGVLVFVDVTASLQLESGRLLTLKSAVLVAVTMLVTLYAEPETEE